MAEVLDLRLLRRTRLSPKPRVQRFIAQAFLRFDYRALELVVESADRIPAEPVIYAMNHTDDFNYWPFQYWIYRHLGRFTATWVKGKNYEHPVVSAFMRWTNNIPVASRGYVITRDFVNVVGRRPEEGEYRALRSAVDGGDAPVGAIPAAVLEQPRDMLGRPFEPSRESYAEAVDAVFAEMMRLSLALNREAFSLGLDLLVYPQGTRSVRLSRGHIGLAQVALWLRATVVPVGCSGGDLIYPERSPFSRPGRIVYRVGEPITPGELASYAPDGPFVPFSRSAEDAYRERFQALVDHVMERIDGLVDPPYRFSNDHESDGTRGTDRFV